MVSRRRALTAGAALAGLAALTPTVAAQPAPEPTVTVVHMDDLAAMCQRLHDELLASQEEENQIEDEITDRVGPAVRDAYVNAVNRYWITHQEWIAAELARHLPGLAPTLRMLQDHIIMRAYQHPGACCTEAEGFEP